MTVSRPAIEVRNTRPEDFAAIIEMCRQVYPQTPPWSVEQLASHLKVFPQGQFVAVDRRRDMVVGAAASLILRWDDYEIDASWRDLTAGGTFENHDPSGRTLYGAEIMVRPGMRGLGVGSAIYRSRRRLAEDLGLLRIRAGARLRDYHRYADRFDPDEYVRRVVAGELRDRTLSFQLRHGFHVLAVVRGYLRNDPESLGYAAVIEWLNEAVASPKELAERDRAWRTFGNAAPV